MVNLEQIDKVSARLGDAAIDPTVWPELMQEICVAAGAIGAALLQGDVRTPDIPRTAGVHDYFRNSYFGEGWHARDVRAQRAVPLLLRGAAVVTDQDIVTPKEMERVGLYAESLIPNGLRWFAAIGFRSGPALWGLSIQRTGREGPFEREDKRILSCLSQRLTETARLSHAVGQAVVTGTTDALGLVGQPALALGRAGDVRSVNAAAEALFDDDIRVSSDRLRLHDQRASAALERLIDQLRTTPDTAVLATEPVVIRRRGKRPIIVRVLPIGGAARRPFADARVLLLLSDLDDRPAADPNLIAQAFGLSPAEARLTALIATGRSSREAAEELCIAHETARSQLKAVFVKTDTHRQSELVALLARLSRLARR